MTRMKEPRRFYVILIILIIMKIISRLTINPQEMDIGMTLLHEHTQCTAAIILFGLPKSFPIIWNQYRQNLIENNPHVHFEISMHLYSDIHFLNNTKNNEITVKMESPETLLRAMGRNDSDFLIQTSQNKFDKQNIEWIRDKHTDTFDPCCWTTETLKNMFRQGNSIKKSYEHAKSLRQDDDIKFFVFARADTFLARPVPLSCQIPSNQIRFPSWQVHNKNELNDRFAVAGPEAAEVYVRAKAEAIYEYIKNPSSSAWRSPLWNSEHILWLWMKENSRMIDVHVQTNRMWAPLLRIRGGAKVERSDRISFPRGYLEFLWRRYSLR